MNSNFNIAAFFRNCTEHNRLAQALNFGYYEVSSLAGFEQALDEIQSRLNFVCLSHETAGGVTLNNAPSTRIVYNVFFAMRHELNNMKARAERFATLRELFRQFMTALMRERTAMQAGMIFIHQDIRFEEIDKFFFSGCACAMASIAIDYPTDLRYRDDEWQ